MQQFNAAAQEGVEGFGDSLKNLFRSKNTIDLGVLQHDLEQELDMYTPGTPGHNRILEQLDNLLGGYSHGGYVGDSLLYRVFGNKSNLF